jgi:molybdopterin synthase catalytic subunit
MFNEMGFVFKVGSVNIQDLIKNIKEKENFKKAGAIFSFTGTVRDSSLNINKDVVAIEIDAWEEKAITSLNKICKSLLEKYNLIDIKIWHAIGTLKLTDDIVYVVLSSAHRKEGLLALDAAIEEYKHLSPIWKKEIYSDGTFNWISKAEITSI